MGNPNLICKMIEKTEGCNKLRDKFVRWADTLLGPYEWSAVLSRLFFKRPQHMSISIRIRRSRGNWIAFALVLVLASTVLTASDTPLPAGNIRRMLHLGANETDRITGFPTSALNVLWDNFVFAGKGPEHLQQPSPAQSVDLRVAVNGGASTVLAWSDVTAADSAGVWEKGVADNYVMYWAVYIYAPTTRTARVVVSADDLAKVWMDGNPTPILASTTNGVISTDITLTAGYHCFISKLYEATGNDYFSIKFTDTSNADMTDLSYTLTDPIAPTISSIVPANAATGVPVWSDIVVTFSEPMDTTVAPNTVATISGGSAAGAWNWADNTHLIWTSTTPFAANTTYTVTPVSSAAKDRSGNMLSGAMAQTFTTIVALSSPALTSITPSRSPPSTVHAVVAGSAFIQGGVKHSPNAVPFQGHYYSYRNIGTDWASAMSIGTAEGGHLVTLNSAPEDNFVWRMGGMINGWIGLTDIYSPGTYKWITGEPLTYTNWASGEPSFNGEHYGIYWYGFQWNDVDSVAASMRPYILEYETRSSPIVKLKPSGQSDIVATNVTFVDGSNLNFDVNLSGAVNGAWDVVLTNPDGVATTLAGGFTVDSNLPPPGLAGYYTFDEASGTIAHDTSGNSNDGTLMGAPAWTPGIRNTCLLFDGSTQYIQIPHSASIDPITGWTLAAFIKRTSINSQHGIIESYQVPGGNYAMRISDTNLLLGFVLNYPQYSQALYGTTVINANQWYHVAVTYDGSSNQLKTYVNGKPETTVTVPFPSAHSTSPVFIGARGTDHASNFAGNIDEARIYNRALSSAEILSLATLPPVAMADSYGVLPNGNITVASPGVLLNDSDPLNLALTAVKDSDVTHGVLALNANGSFTYTPTSGYSGPDSFTYHAVNSNNQSSATVTVAIDVQILTVTSMSPSPGTNLTASPSSIVLTLSGRIDPASVNALSVHLVRAGADGVFGTTDDINVSPTSVMVVNGSQIKLDFTGIALSNDKYKITLSGSSPQISTMAADFKLDESSGASVLDSSGNLNNGMLIGTQGWTVGQINGALNLNASSYVTVNNAVLGNFGTTDFSVAFWIKTQTTNCILIGNRYSNDHGPFWTVKVSTAGSVAFEVDQDGAGTNYNDVFGSKTVSDGTWHHIGVVRTGASQKVYINGVLDGSGSGPGTANVSSGGAMIIGTDVNINESSRFVGTIDEVRIFNHAITPGEIQMVSIPSSAILDQYGTTLDGEFNGTFPSGNGTPGGDFIAQFQISLPATTLACTTPTPINYGAASVSLSATVSSNGQSINDGTITFQLTNGGTNVGSPVTSAAVKSNTASVNYAIPLGTSVGNYAVLASYNSGGTFAPSMDNAKVLAINPAPLSATANNASRAYGAANPTLDGLIVGIQYGDNITATYATNATVTSPAGPYRIVSTLVDPGGKLINYVLTSNTGTLTITPALLSVTAANASRAYGAANPVFSGTITGIQNGDNITANYATSATVVSPVSTYPIVSTLFDPNNKLSNYAVTSISGVLTVTTAPLSVAAFNNTRPYGAANPVFSGVFSGILNGDNILAVYNSNATAASPVGFYAIVPTLIDPNNKVGNYLVTLSNGTLTVTPAIAPLITSALTGSGVQGTSFGYTITSDGSAPMTFQAAGLPAGLGLSGAVISGTPTETGVFNIVLAVTNAAGSASQTLMLVITHASGTNHPPVFTSPPTASANPSATGVATTLTASATDADGDALDYTWDFGDGSTSTGASVAKIYSTAGVYIVKVVVSDGQASDTQSINLVVNDQPSAGKLAVSKVNLSFNFLKSASDSLTIAGHIPIHAGFNPAGKTVRVLIGGLDKTYTLTTKGESADKAFTLNGKPKSGASAFTFTLKKQDLFAPLAELGFSKTKTNPNLAVAVVIVLDGVRYIDNSMIDYKVKTNKNGPLSGKGRK
jgi:hypothetical protein